LRRFITLTTDFGLSDPYVASIKGSIYSTNPDAAVIDVSHDIRPQNIEQAIFILEYALPYLPENSIHVLVVDPGVGTDRRGVALTTPQGIFVAPDNGLLSVALSDEVRSAVTSPSAVALPPHYNAYQLTNDSYHRTPVSVTFHGRDIFSPVAAHLSLGVPPKDLGPPLTEIVAVPPFRATSDADGSLSARIVHIDRYGNLITNVRAGQIAAGVASIEIADRSISGLSRTYLDTTNLTAIVASTGFLAIVMPNGSAAAELGIDIGEPVAVRLR
jgi:S-adenosylmethionine hydrolase